MKKLTLILLSALLALSLCACVAEEEDPSSIDDYAAPDFTHTLTAEQGGGVLTFEEGHAESAVIINYEGGAATPHVVTVPEIIAEREVSGIGKEAFYMLSNVEEVKLPETVTYIGEFAFAGCTSLKTITIPASVTKIEAYAFAECTSLEAIVFEGKALESIGDFAFLGCTSLKTVVLPEGVKTIGKQSFSKCTAITSLKMPSTLEKIGNLAFYGCDGLDKDGALVLTASITEIGEFAFTGINKNYIVAPEGSYAADYVSKMAAEEETEAE